MSSLRHEYNKSKARKEKIVSEAAIKWLGKNIIIINEKIDRTTVSQLIDRIQNFEDTFGKFSDRLPAVSQYLTAAEQGLQQVITGKANDKKASAMLKKLTILYFTFSDFFSRDLPILLRMKIFSAAKEQPNVRMDMIRNRNETSYDPYVVRDALANAIKPTREEKKLLSKIYRASLLPKLNAEEIADQLMTLSFSELEELTQIGKVPLAATGEEFESDELGLENEIPVPESFNKDGEILTEQVLLEAKELLSEAKIEQLQSAVANLKQLVDSSGLKTLSGKVDRLQSDLIQAMNSDAFVSYWETVQQAGGEGGATGFMKKLQSLFSQSPQSKKIAELIGKANATVEIFNSIASAWPDIQKAISDKASLNSHDVNNIKQILLRSASQNKGGIAGFLGNKLNQLIGRGSTEPYISAEEIVNALLGGLE